MAKIERSNTNVFSETFEVVEYEVPLQAKKFDDIVPLTSLHIWLKSDILRFLRGRGNLKENPKKALKLV